jgi:hypothetical protein
MIRTPHPDLARPAVEAVLERETKDWRLEVSTRATGGDVTLLYLVYRRKSAPRDGLLKDIETLTRSEGVTVDVTPGFIVPGIQPHPAQD